MENLNITNINPKKVNFKSLNYGKLILRVGLGIVFLYFSISQFQNPERWVLLLPKIFQNTSNPLIFIYINAVFDLVMGLLILSGKLLKIVSIIGFLHLISITIFALGLTPQGIRDLGLAFAVLSLFFNEK